MTRRGFLQSTSVPGALGLSARMMGRDYDGPLPPRTKMGIASTSYLAVWKPKDTLEFLEHCHSLGAAGIQAAVNGDPSRIRARADQLGMYVEAMVSLPKNGDTAGFERQLQGAKAAGAARLRGGALGGRRYETFTSLSEWQEWVAKTHRSLDAAVPILEKHKLPLGLENHKDWTIDEHVALVKKYSSEYLGACLDFGNNISLLDDPMEVIERLAPFTVTTHLKNMGVAPYADGFLLSELPLEDGFLDLQKAVSMVQKAKPQVQFSLEMITRDPLEVPCLTDKYWVTFPDRPGRYLARTLKLVQTHSSGKPLPRFSQLNHEDQLRAEEENVKACMRWGQKNLPV
jgi:sugar phosphate isomerase/epimerase